MDCGLQHLSHLVELRARSQCWHLGLHTGGQSTFGVQLGTEIKSVGLLQWLYNQQGKAFLKRCCLISCSMLRASPQVIAPVSPFLCNSFMFVDLFKEKDSLNNATM